MYLISREIREKITNNVQLRREGEIVREKEAGDHRGADKAGDGEMSGSEVEGDGPVIN